MKITLRQKPLKDGNASLYLDYYDKGKREYEFLDLEGNGNQGGADD